MQVHRHRKRAGLSLIELLVALPLSVTIGALAVGLLLHTSRQARALISQIEALDRLEEAQLILRAELAPLQGTDLSIHADSLLEAQVRVATLRVCAAPDSTRLEVALAVSAGQPPAADPGVSLRPGDSLIVWTRADSAGGAPIARRRRLQGPPLALPVAACADHGGQEGMERRWRLMLEPEGMNPSLPLIGSPVDVRRTIRYRPYRSGRSWWLGRQALVGGKWETIQPAVGPLVSPAEGGVRWTLITGPSGEVLGIDVRIRTPREHDGGRMPRSQYVDSSRAMIELMGAPPLPPTS